MEMSPWWKSVALATCLLAAIVPSSQAADNEIKNGAFDQGMANWDVKLVGNGRRKADKEKATDVVADGTETPDLKVLQVTLSAFDRCHISQDFRVPSNVEALTVSFRYKASADFKASSPPAVLVGIEGTTNPNPAGYWPRFAPGVTGWQIYSNRFLVVGKKIPPVLRISVGGGSGTVLLDDIKVTAEAR